MDFGEDEKAGGEILRSLLTTKMDNNTLVSLLAINFCFDYFH